MWISTFLSTLSAVLAIGCVLMVRRCIRERKMRREALSEAVDGTQFKINVIVSATSTAEVEDRPNSPCPYFAVFRRGISEKIDVKRFYYNPSSPDDRECTRIHAEEVAEKLNEKP